MNGYYLSIIGVVLIHNVIEVLQRFTLKLQNSDYMVAKGTVYFKLSLGSYVRGWFFLNGPG